MYEVYLTYDGVGALLYVGMTERGYTKRLSEHDYNKAIWVPLVARHTIRTYGTREAAFAVEQRAIRWLKPKHNIRIPKAPSEALKPKGARRYIISTGVRLSDLPASAISDLWARIRPILAQHTDEELEQFARHWAQVTTNMRAAHD